MFDPKPHQFVLFVEFPLFDEALEERVHSLDGVVHRLETVRRRLVAHAVTVGDLRGRAANGERAP